MAEVTLATLAAQLTKLIERIDAVEQRLGARIDAVEQKLGARIDGVERRIDAVEHKVDTIERMVDEATGGGKLTLAFLNRQVDRVLQEQAAIRAELRWHGAALTRLDATVQGVITELRAQSDRQQVQDQLWHKVEARVDALEQR